MPVFTSSIEVTADYPTIKPSLNLNFARARALDPRVGFERASVGTYVGRDGLIKTAGENEPRFDHDPVTLESLGLLIEESRTNIVHGNPGQANLVVTSGQANSLTGNNDAYKLAKNSPSSNSQSHGSWGVTGNVSTTSYVMSIFVKKINHSKFFMQTVAQSADNLYVYIDIDTGVTSFTDYTASGNLTVTASIETYTDGWYRIISRVQGFAANTLASGFRFGFGDPSSGSQQYTNGDDEVLVYGAQIEDGSFATSYIPSADSSSSVTRGEDRADIRGDAFQSIFNSNFNEFSGVIEFDNDDLPQPPSASYYSIFELWGESTNFENRFQITRDNDSPYGIETRGFGSNTALFSNGNISGSNTAAVKKLAFSWNIPDYSTSTGRRWAFSFSGEAVDLVGNNNGTGVPQFTRMGIGYSPTRNEGQSKTHFKRITIYLKVLTDAQLQLLTS